MFQTKRKLVLLSISFIMLILLASLSGCGARQSNTGSLTSRVIDAEGNVVVNAVVCSIFVADEKVYSDIDGGFHLPELPVGLNTIIITHPDFTLEEHKIDIIPGKGTYIESIKLNKTNAPHRIYNIQVAEVTPTTARITWSTYREVICNIEYGNTTTYGTIYREERAATEHSVIIGNLESDTIYHFKIQYIDENSISHYSYDFPFKTDIPDRPELPAIVRFLPMNTHGVIDIEWKAPEKGQVYGYNVYRKTDDSSWQKINDAPIGERVRSFSDKGAEPGSFCSYAVTALNEFVAESDKALSGIIFVPGVINRNVSIKTNHSPVMIYSDLVIAAGFNFSVEAGCEFLIDEKDAFGAGLDEQRIEITVHGRIDLAGTKENPIKFGVLTGSGKRDHWAGIRVISSSTGISQLNNVHLFGCNGFAIEISADRANLSGISIAYSENGLALKGLKDIINIADCSFSQIRGTALSIDRCKKILLSDSIFSEVGTGLKCFTDDTEDQLYITDTDVNCYDFGITGTFGKSKIIRTLITTDNGFGVKFENILSPRENYIDHCTIDAYQGIIIESGNVVIENNIIVNRNNRGLVGIKNLSGSTPQHEYNNIYGFEKAYDGCSGGTGAIQTFSDFVGGNPYSYELMPDSTLNLQDRYGSELGRYGISRL